MITSLRHLRDQKRAGDILLRLASDRRKKVRFCSLLGKRFRERVWEERYGMQVITSRCTIDVNVLKAIQRRRKSVRGNMVGIMKGKEA